MLCPQPGYKAYLENLGNNIAERLLKRKKQCWYSVHWAHYSLPASSGLRTVLPRLLQTSESSLEGPRHRDLRWHCLYHRAIKARTWEHWWGRLTLSVSAWMNPCLSVASHIPTTFSQTFPSVLRDQFLLIHPSAVWLSALPKCPFLPLSHSPGVKKDMPLSWLTLVLFLQAST